MKKLHLICNSHIDTIGNGRGMKVFLLLLAVCLFSFSSCNFGWLKPNDGKDVETQRGFEYSVYGVSVDKATQLAWEQQEGTEVSFTSSDMSIVSVSEDGEIAGIKNGNATITATEKKGNTIVRTFDCQVEVNDGEYDTLMGDETFIKWEGRNFYHNNVVNCFNTASGFEALFYGTSFSAQILAAGSTEVTMAVMIDDLHSPVDNTLTLTATRSPVNHTLAEDLEEGYHRIRVYKLTEAMQSSVAFKSMQTDGYFWARPNDKKYKMEIYGDSITVGYNNMRESMEEVPSPQNGCMTYGWLAAQELDADVNIIARTGIGMSSSNGASFFMKNAYKLTYCSEKEYLGYNNRNPKWNFSSYIPDIVVINVGTNDGWGGVLARDYIRLMREMCQDLIDNYGKQVKILFCGGVITSAYMQDLLELSEEFENADVLMLPSVGLHPNVAQHQEIADALAEKVKMMLQ